MPMIHHHNLNTSHQDLRQYKNRGEEKEEEKFVTVQRVSTVPSKTTKTKNCTPSSSRNSTIQMSSSHSTKNKNPPRPLSSYSLWSEGPSLRTHSKNKPLLASGSQLNLITNCEMLNGISQTMAHRRSRHSDFGDISATLNPKRVSVATSTFWEGHPDMAQLFGKGSESEECVRRSSLWLSGSGEMDNWAWGDPPAVKKGILLQQRERLLARWKERYCILTRDYLHCFRRTTSIHRSGVRLSDMGNFIFKLRLADIEDIQMETRRVGTVISIIIPGEPKILFKVIGENQETMHQWFTLLKECLYMSKERRQALRTLHSTNTNSRSISEGSPSENSSNSSEKDSLKRNIEKLSLNDYDEIREEEVEEEKVVLRRDVMREMPKTSLREFMGRNRHSLAQDVPDFPSYYQSPSLVIGGGGKRSSMLIGSNLSSLSGAPTFSRVPPHLHHHLYSNSRHSSEITFRKLS